MLHLNYSSHAWNPRNWEEIFTNAYIQYTVWCCSMCSRYYMEALPALSCLSRASLSIFFNVVAPVFPLYNIRQVRCGTATSTLLWRSWKTAPQLKPPGWVESNYSAVVTWKSRGCHYVVIRYTMSNDAFFLPQRTSNVLEVFKTAEKKKMLSAEMFVKWVMSAAWVCCLGFSEWRGLKLAFCFPLKLLTMQANCRACNRIHF